MTSCHRIYYRTTAQSGVIDMEDRDISSSALISAVVIELGRPAQAAKPGRMSLACGELDTFALREAALNEAHGLPTHANENSVR